MNLLPAQQLTEPIDYKIAPMRLSMNQEVRPGLPVMVLKDDEGILAAVDSSSDHLLKRYLGVAGRSVVGRGVLVEAYFRRSDWFVAWRPYSPVPRGVPNKD